jgi:hypothetical protein
MIAQTDVFQVHCFLPWIMAIVLKASRIAIIRKLSTETPKNSLGGHLLDDGDTQLMMLWESATLRREDNPVDYCTTLHTKMVTQNCGMDHLEQGSMAQANETLGQLRGI